MVHSTTHIEGGATSYCRFALTHRFLDPEKQDEYAYQPHLLERVGGAIIWPQGWVADRALKEIRNPITIVSLTMLGVLMTSIAFYPEKVRSTIATFFPLVRKIEPWMLKGALYAFLQTTAAGLGLRAVGRFANPDLVHAFNAKKIEPYPLGTIRVVEQQ